MYAVSLPYDDMEVKHMPRKARDTWLGTREARLKLTPRREPYWRTISEGRAIGYRRLGGQKSGSWIARHYDAATGRRYQALGNADDYLEPDGAKVFVFAEAQDRANEWFRQLSKQDGKSIDPITVKQAIDHYLDDYLARGGKAERPMRSMISHIDELGRHRVIDLTAAMIRGWHQRLAAADAKMRTSAKASRVNIRKAKDADGRRARQSTANRCLTVLRAALNSAYRDGLVPSDDAWRRVRAFQNVSAARIRYLLDKEAVRLVNACQPALRALVVAALVTGCRLGELVRLRRADFDVEAQALHIQQAKSGKPRTVPLTAEATRHFSALAAGKSGTALLLVRDDGQPWGENHQQGPLRQACAVAKIEPAISFHILRHTLASRLAMRGLPMTVIAAALGNTEAICARHYAHLAPNYVADTLRSVDSLGVVPETNVTELRRSTG
jgi:integrase